MTVRHIVGVFSCLALASLFAFAQEDEEKVEKAENDGYRVILNRNPFGIKPPPITNNTATSAAPSTVFLVGISRLGTTPKAYLSVKDNKNTSTSYGLYEGEEENGITVLAISEDSVVKIMKQGVEMSLTFKDNGIAPIYSAAPANPLGGGPVAFNAQGQPYNPNGLPNGGPVGTVTTRTPTSTTYSPNNNYNTLNNNNATATGNARTIPTRPMRMGNSSGTPPPPPQSQPPITSEQIEYDRQRFSRAIDAGDAPPLPPTEYSAPPPLPQ